MALNSSVYCARCVHFTFFIVSCSVALTSWLTIIRPQIHRMIIAQQLGCVVLGFQEDTTWWPNFRAWMNESTTCQIFKPLLNCFDETQAYMCIIYCFSAQKGKKTVEVPSHCRIGPICRTRSIQTGMVFSPSAIFPQHQSDRYQPCFWHRFLQIVEAEYTS